MKTKPFMYALMLATAIGVVSTGAQARDDAAHNDTTMGNTTSSQYEQNTTANTTLSANQVQDIQESLRDEGYTVSVDGVWGPNTQNALRDFQQANNLDASGTIDQSTLAALDIETSSFMDNR